jgi:hypothetical protein
LFCSDALMNPREHVTKISHRIVCVEFYRSRKARRTSTR